MNIENFKILSEDLNYLNLQEIKLLCEHYKIPYRIMLELKDGTLKQTAEMDRKGIVLERIRKFLKNGKIAKPTIYPRTVINKEKIPQILTEKTSVFYGQYKIRLEKTKKTKS